MLFEMIRTEKLGSSLCAQQRVELRREVFFVCDIYSSAADFLLYQVPYQIQGNKHTELCHFLGK